MIAFQEIICFKVCVATLRKSVTMGPCVAMIIFRVEAAARTSALTSARIHTAQCPRTHTHTQTNGTTHANTCNHTHTGNHTRTCLVTLAKTTGPSMMYCRLRSEGCLMDWKLSPTSFRPIFDCDLQKHNIDFCLLIYRTQQLIKVCWLTSHHRRSREWWGISEVTARSPTVQYVKLYVTVW